MTTYKVVGWALRRRRGLVPAAEDDRTARYPVTWYDAAQGRAQVMLGNCAYFVALSPREYGGLPAREFPPPYTDMEE